MTDIIKKYDFIVSLGRFCHTTAMLNNNNLKIIDGPWDWTSFKEQFPQVAKKYQRRAERVLNFIKYSDSILLVYMNNIADQQRNLPLDEKKVLRVMKKLRKKISR